MVKIIVTIVKISCGGSNYYRNIIKITVVRTKFSPND